MSSSSPSLLLEVLVSAEVGAAIVEDVDSVLDGGLLLLDDDGFDELLSSATGAVRLCSSGSAIVVVV